VEPDQEHAFITKFLSHWGQALDQPPRTPSSPMKMSELRKD